MDKELKTELSEIKDAFHKADKDIVVLITRFDGLEEKVDKLNGVATVLASHETSIKFLTYKWKTMFRAGVLGIFGLAIFLARSAIIKWWIK